MYREPKAAKRLYFDVIPRQVDEYYQFLGGFERQDLRSRLSNPVWHIHSGKPPKIDMPITFAMLLTLVSSSNAENAETLWGFIDRYRPGVTPKRIPSSMSWSNMPFIISVTLSCRKRNSATPLTASARP